MSSTLSSPSARPDPIAISLLIINGCLIALMLALAKIVTAQGVSPIAYAFWQTLGAGLLLGTLALRQQYGKLNGSVMRYFIISGATGIAIPNATAFFVVGQIGAGFTASLYAFPPIFTLLMSLAIRLETINPRQFLGIGLACAGCLWMVWLQHDANSDEILYWYLAGLLIPVSLAFGNIYRSLAWPANLPPLVLASGMLLMAALLLWAYHLTGDRSLTAGVLNGHNAWLLAVQAVLTALTYLGFFELQKRSSPLFLSQMGAVAALAGLAISLIWFDVAYRHALWSGVAAVLAGILITTRTSTVSVRT